MRTLLQRLLGRGQPTQPAQPVTPAIPYRRPETPTGVSSSLKDLNRLLEARDSGDKNTVFDLAYGRRGDLTLVPQEWHNEYLAYCAKRRKMEEA